jgi:hypothetical protein
MVRFIFAVTADHIGACPRPWQVINALSKLLVELESRGALLPPEDLPDVEQVCDRPCFAFPMTGLHSDPWTPLTAGPSASRLLWAH